MNPNEENQNNSLPSYDQNAANNYQPRSEALNQTINQPVNPEQGLQNNQLNDQKNAKSKNMSSQLNVKKIVGISAGIIAGVVIISAAFTIIGKAIRNNDQPTKNDTSSEKTTDDEEATTPSKIDLQLAVDQWVTDNNSDNVGIEIYDLDNNAVVARHNEDTPFRIESIYKMFVAYEGYYRIDHSIWNADDIYPITNDYANQPYTRAHCLDHMIRFSYSPCAEAMWNEIGQDNLQQIYNQRGFKNTAISAITSTPSDLTKLYQIYWAHSDLSDKSWEAIKDSMLNQTAPKTATEAYTSNWRKGLPSGFATATIYDKVGWLGNDPTDPDSYLFFDDAAFAVFPETKNKDTGAKIPERHYIIIALTKDTKSTKLVELGRKIENAVRTADNY